MDTLFRKINARNMKLGQASGSKASVTYVGSLCCVLGNSLLQTKPKYTLGMPNNPTSTVSTYCLKKFAGFIRATHETNEFFHIIDKYGNDFWFTPQNGLLRIINGLDYVPIIHPVESPPVTNQTILRKSSRTSKPTVKMKEYKQQQQQEKEQKVEKQQEKEQKVEKQQKQQKQHTQLHQSPTNIINNESDIAVPHNTLPEENASVHHNTLSLLTHLKFACRNNKAIRHMQQTGAMLHLPRIRDLKYCCPICAVVKAPKVSSTKSAPQRNLTPGQMLCMDFCFYRTTSIRGFTSYLSVTCYVTGYSFVIPTRSKRAPLDIIKWLIEVLKRQGFVVIIVRFDEGGELARSTEVCSLLTNLNIVMESSGGYSSDLLGKDERQHRTYGEMVRTMLFAANLPPTFWCYAIMYAVYIKRRWCNYPHDKTPYELWFKKKPSFHHIHIFGSPVTIVAEEEKKESGQNKVGRFLGFASTSAVILYQNISNGTLGRARHGRIDDFFMLALTHEEFVCPASTLIQSTLNDKALPKIDTEPPVLPYALTPFDENMTFTYTVTLPKSGPLGLEIIDDEVFGLPLICEMDINSNFVKNCKKKLHTNSWIISIHHEEPITIHRFLEYIQFLRKNDILEVQVTLMKRINQHNTKYQEFRSQFDSFRPIVAKSTINILPTTKYAVQLPSKPQAPKTWTDLKDSPLREFWIKAVFERYLKNHNVGLLSAPVLRKLLPPEAIIQRSVSTFKVKTTEVADIWDLYFRVCADGSKMVQGIHFMFSHCSVSGNSSLLILLAISAKCRLVLTIHDIGNAFQGTPREESKESPPIYITMPPYYMQWFKKSFPKVKIDDKETYVLQMFSNMQGTKNASRDFNILITKIFATINLFPTSVDSGMYVMSKNNKILILAIQTDDLLIATDDSKLRELVITTLQQAFQVTSQGGTLLKFLNFRIIQSVHGISADQTPHITEMLQKYFPSGMQVQKTDTPLRSDRQFQEEIYNSVPATPPELKALEKEFGFKYGTVYGELMHISAWSRPDIANAINRLGVFQAGPCRLGFESILRVLKYLKTHPNCPLMYSRDPFSASSTFESHFHKTKPNEGLTVPHCLCGHVDSSFAQDKDDRHSISGRVETIGTTAVSWKTTKQTSCATSATDAETRAFYLEAKRIKKHRSLMQQIGLSIPDPTPIVSALENNYNSPTPIFEDNKGTRDMIHANKITSNLKHIDLPLKYVHQLNEAGTLICLPCDSQNMFADTFTKQETGPKHLQARKWYMGQKFYPPVNSEHYKLLTSHLPLSM